MRVVDFNSFINIRPIDNNAYNMGSLGGFMFEELDTVILKSDMTEHVNDVRSMARSEILHVRGFAAA